MRFSSCLIILIIAVAYGIKPKYLDLTLHTISSNTGDTFEYQWFPVAIKAVAVKVRAEHNARIALKFRDGNPQTSMAEILLGQDFNTKSSIRLNQHIVKNVGNDSDHIDGLFDTISILDKKNFRLFWISWEDKFLKVGFWGAYLPFMYMKDRLPFEVNFIGVATGYGADGDWRIEDQDDYLGNALENLTSGYSMDYSLLIPIKLKPNAIFNLEAIPVATTNKAKMNFALEFRTEVELLDTVNIEPDPKHRVFWIAIKINSNARVSETETHLYPMSPNAKTSFRIAKQKVNGVFASYIKIIGTLSKLQMIRISVDGEDIKEYWLTPQATRAFAITKNKCRPDVDLDKPYINLRGLTYESTYDPHQ